MLERAGLADALGHGHNLAGVHVDDAGVDADVGLGVGMADAAEAKAAPVAAAAAEVGLLGLIAELGDAADDDGVHAQQACRSWRRWWGRRGWSWRSSARS